jgi:NTP pyrophosphatase (non-canonical NTP hydrolase)
MPQNDLDELTGRTADGISRVVRYIEMNEAVDAIDGHARRANQAALDQLWQAMSEDEQAEVKRALETRREAAQKPSEADVRRVVKLTESVAEAFCNYTSGSGFDAKQLAAEVPKLLDSHVHLGALKRAGYGIEEIMRLDVENRGLRDTLALAPKAPAETQATISRWADETFGPSGSNARAVARANREMSELLEHVTADDRHPEAAEEVADIVICLYRIAARLGVDLHGEIDRKMVTNRARKWRLDGTGHGYHVKETVSPKDTSSYAKKRQYVRAVRWTGEVTPELVAILGDRKFVIGEHHRIAFGIGWTVDVGDWIVSGDSVHKDGFQIVVLSHDVFARVYEEVS